jgi:L-ascorbate metabolism protein UlaG (beta-lactamase superfamily)
MVVPFTIIVKCGYNEGSSQEDDDTPSNYVQEERSMWTFFGLALVLLPILLLSWFAYQYWRYLGRLPKPPYKRPPERPKVTEWNDDQVTITWIGHSTLYINLFGTKIITDPVFGERVGMYLGAGVQLGPKRFTAPALSAEEVGEVDLILLSHGHFDHFDIPSLRKLFHPRTQVITAKGTSRLLRRFRFAEVRETEPFEQVLLRDGVTVTAFPVRHWGNRYPWNHDYGWTGYLIEKNGVRLLFAGDTAYTPAFADLRGYGPIDVAFMPIGAYSPDSYQRAHCTPEQAWQMFVDSGATWFVPIHWDTFVLSQEPVDEPLKRLLAAAGSEEHRIVLRRQGEVFVVSHARRG